MSGYNYISRFLACKTAPLEEEPHLAQVREVVDEWLDDYNRAADRTKRPHQALVFLTPKEFKEAA